MPFDDATLRVTCPEIEFLDEMVNVLSSPRKWLKHDLESADGSRHCILGAVEAVGVKPWSTDCASSVEREILNLVGPRFAEIGAFNDHKRTKHKDVLALLARTRDVFVVRAIQEARQFSLDV